MNATAIAASASHPAALDTGRRAGRADRGEADFEQQLAGVLVSGHPSADHADAEHPDRLPRVRRPNEPDAHANDHAQTNVLHPSMVTPPLVILPVVPVAAPAVTVGSAETVGPVPDAGTAEVVTASLPAEPGVPAPVTTEPPGAPAPVTTEPVPAEAEVAVTRSEDGPKLVASHGPDTAGGSEVVPEVTPDPSPEPAPSVAISPVRPMTASTASERAGVAVDPQPARGADALQRARLSGPPGTARLEVDLADEGLGPLRLEVLANGSTLHLQLSSSDATVRELISRHATDLRADMSAAGLDFGSFDVGSAPGHHRPPGDPSDGRASDSSSRGRGIGTVEERPDPSAERRTIPSTSDIVLDLRL